MRYDLTADARRILEAFMAQRQRVESRLMCASPEARDEWRRMMARWPSTADIERGCLTVSPETLGHFLSKAERFGQLLETLPNRSREEG